jgi:methylthioribose-1-phosphate isomerase
VKVAGIWRRTIEVIDDQIVVLDQTKLPYEVAWLPLATVDDVINAIATMIVRGAPLIGATAAYGVAMATAIDPRDDALAAACARIAAARPTAINLRWAVDRMRTWLLKSPIDERAAVAMRAAAEICNDDVATCEAIGRHGLALIKAIAETKQTVNVLTHCNAGWLATVDWGTALAPIYQAHEAGIAVHVWVDETRPRNQGLLTAWELAQHGVAHTLIVDNAGGHVMQQGNVDLCIVGTDRTTRGGDVCNKIGTYLKALAAYDCKVPFYAAVPASSIDWTVERGSEIPIEERDPDEVRKIRGTELVPARHPVANPAFDVTPARLVTGLITERGIAAPSGLLALFPEHA